MPRKMTKTVVTLGGDSFETILPSGLVAPYTQRLNALVQDYTTLTTTTEGDESMADIHEMANLFLTHVCQFEAAFGASRVPPNLWVMAGIIHSTIEETQG